MCRRALLSIAIDLCVCVALSAPALGADDLEIRTHPAGDSIETAADGFDLWFEARGEGPAIIFVCRDPNEHRELAEAMADAYRVVLYEPRFMVMEQKRAVAAAESTDGPQVEALTAHLAGRTLDWDLTALTQRPVELEVADLHTVADSAGVDDFVIAGYSGTCAYAAFLAPNSGRTVGLIAGGFSILGPKDYWVGVLDGSRQMALQHGMTADAAASFMTGLFYRDLGGRGRDGDFARLAGPKIVSFGSGDTGPTDPMSQMLSQARIAQRIRHYRADYERLGFTLIELEGLHHVDAYLAVDIAEPLIRRALVEAGHE
jgi:hypothetical protein